MELIRAEKGRVLCIKTEQQANHELRQIASLQTVKLVLLSKAIAQLSHELRGLNRQVLL